MALAVGRGRFASFWLITIISCCLFTQTLLPIGLLAQFPTLGGKMPPAFRNAFRKLEQSKSVFGSLELQQANTCNPCQHLDGVCHEYGVDKEGQGMLAQAHPIASCGVGHLVPHPSHGVDHHQRQHGLREDESGEKDARKQRCHILHKVEERSVGAVVLANSTLVLQNNSRHPATLLGVHLVDLHVGPQISSIARHHCALVEHRVAVEEPAQDAEDPSGKVDITELQISIGDSVNGGHSLIVGCPARPIDGHGNGSADEARHQEEDRELLGHACPGSCFILDHRQA
mmetsp:Transcript_83666/g.150935  ORF Transcript_83666/g.150935 Transcript_83666/m.150935 type:complete len:286 (+) Transcript_83666:152-1009(+)